MTNAAPEELWPGDAPIEGSPAALAAEEAAPVEADPIAAQPEAAPAVVDPASGLPGA